MKSPNKYSECKIQLFDQVNVFKPEINNIIVEKFKTAMESEVQELSKTGGVTPQANAMLNKTEISFDEAKTMENINDGFKNLSERFISGLNATSEEDENDIEQIDAKLQFIPELTITIKAKI